MSHTLLEGVNEILKRLTSSFRIDGPGSGVPSKGVGHLDIQQVRAVPRCGAVEEPRGQSASCSSLQENLEDQRGIDDRGHRRSRSCRITLAGGSFGSIGVR